MAKERRMFRQVGGSWAPPLAPTKLQTYEVLAATAPARTRDYMGQLIKMLRVFWETPQSKRAAVANGHRTHAVVPLEEEEVKRIWDYVPWSPEIDMMSAAIDEEVPPSGDVALRNAAYHLIWYARELVCDREPVTNDILPAMREEMKRLALQG